MAMSYETSLEDVVSVLTKSIKGEMEAEIKRQLQAQIEPLIEETSKKIAAKLFAVIKTARRPLDGDIIVQLKIDTKNVDWKP